MFELTLPSECIVVALVLSFHRVLIVANIVTTSDPASSCLLGLSIRIHERSHSMIVKRIRFNEINDIEPIVLTSFGI
jgi:hypothetical protein